MCWWWRWAGGEAAINEISPLSSFLAIEVFLRSISGKEETKFTVESKYVLPLCPEASCVFSEHGIKFKMMTLQMDRLKQYPPGHSKPERMALVGISGCCGLLPGLRKGLASAIARSIVHSSFRAEAIQMKQYCKQAPDSPEISDLFIIFMYVCVPV